MHKEHHYSANITWMGNLGEGTKTYNGYSRNHLISINHRPDLEGSADAAFLGDISKHNPEDLILASLSSCHMLWYLHLCADNGIIVIEYKDEASGVMVQTAAGGRFREVVLHPQVTITDSTKIEMANALHDDANKHCFIANSCNFPVLHKPSCKTK